MQSIILSVYKKGDKTDCSDYQNKSLLCTKFYPTSFSQG
jgi:hypothetical protein